MRKTIPCDRCSGYGSVPINSRGRVDCARCDGSGMLSESRLVWLIDHYAPWKFVEADGPYATELRAPFIAHCQAQLEILRNKPSRVTREVNLETVEEQLRMVETEVKNLRNLLLGE